MPVPSTSLRQGWQEARQAGAEAQYNWLKFNGVVPVRIQVPPGVITKSPPTRAYFSPKQHRQPKVLVAVDVNGQLVRADNSLEPGLHWSNGLDAFDAPRGGAAKPAARWEAWEAGVATRAEDWCDSDTEAEAEAEADMSVEELLQRSRTSLARFKTAHSPTKESSSSLGGACEAGSEHEATCWARWLAKKLDFSSPLAEPLTFSPRPLSPAPAELALQSRGDEEETVGPPQPCRTTEHPWRNLASVHTPRMAS